MSSVIHGTCNCTDKIFCYLNINGTVLIPGASANLSHHCKLNTPSSLDVSSAFDNARTDFTVGGIGPGMMAACLRDNFSLKDGYAPL